MSRSVVRFDSSLMLKWGNTGLVFEEGLNFLNATWPRGQHALPSLQQESSTEGERTFLVRKPRLVRSPRIEVCLGSQD